MTTLETILEIRFGILELMDEISHIETDRSIGKPVSKETDWVDCIQSAEVLLRDAYAELGAAVEALKGDA